jgi:signal transduction histidine kinase
MRTPDASDFQTLFERVSDPAVVLDEGGRRVVAANLPFAALVARPAGSLVGRELEGLLAFDGEGSEVVEGGECGGRAFVGEGRGSVPVRLESFACLWGGRAARVLLVRRARSADDAGRAALEADRLNALLEYLNEATEQLEAVNRVVAAVNSSRTIEEVFDLASEQIRALVPFDRASLALCDENCEALSVFAISGARKGSLAVGARGRLRGSVTEAALAERRMVVIPELRDETRFNAYEDLRREGFRSAVCVPLFSTDRAVGSLNLTSREPRALERRHLLALERLAPPLALAIEKVLLLEASRDRNEELRGLFEISRVFTTLTDTSEISGRLARAIARLVGGEMCLIATYDRRTNSVRAESPGFGTPPGLIGEFHFKLERGNAHAPVYQTGEAFLSNDPSEDARLNRDFTARWGIESALSVPMRLKTELIGFIYVANRAGGFRERELRLLEIFAVQAAETIVNARLFLTIQAQAEREAVVNRLLLSLQRSGEPRQKVRAVIERIGEVLEVDRCVAVLFADSEHEDYYGEWCADGVEPVTDWRDVRERSPIRHLLRTARRPLYASDVAAHPLAEGFSDLLGRTRIKSMAVVPVMHQGRVIGSISAHQTRRVRHWSEDDIDLLAAVATHVGATLENARLISELREANRLKDQFLATLSHELRTPLTAITGWVELLSESKALESDADLADGVSAISASATSLTQLISDLLDLSRIQRGVLRLERQMLDLNQVAATAARNVRQAATARKLELRLELADDLPQTIADAQRVQQIFWNLLSNALKFTPPGGRVTLRTRLVDEGLKQGEGGEGGSRIRWVETEVEDTGEGIPADFMPFIWDRFRQADSSATRRHGGLGIGLSLVKELVEAHGGHVEAFSAGRGARFTVRLPVIEAEQWLEHEPRFETQKQVDKG